MSSASDSAKAAPSQTAALLAATRHQSEASDPEVSAWVSANAGSGKTHVLSQRVIRLLLAGTPPGRILCLTYTKAAAANMANRVLTTLGRWVALPDAALDEEIARTDHRRPTPELRAIARRLFAAALETPGGLKIQTIHAFCGGLLHQFPFEAGVAAGFRELDDAGRMDLLARIRTDLIVEATSQPHAALGRALAHLMGETGDKGIDDLIAASVDARARILKLAQEADARRAQIAAGLGLDPSITRDGLLRQVLDGPHLPQSEWRAVAAEIAASGKATDQKRAASLLAAAGAGSQEEALAAYLGVFLKADGGPRTDKDLLTKGAREALPTIAARMEAERDRIALLEDQRRAVEVLERTDAALTLGAAACARYESAKADRGLLDFDDLIARTAALLNRVPASWVHFKLDRGIDHVLVDEAQDTSPAQWAVVHGLIDDFFAGAGARGPLRRTLFVVGDEKQSIFSFQGADPRTFGEMRHRVAREAGNTGFRNVRLPHSFRSAPGVLAAVDAVFASQAARAGLSDDDAKTVHEAIRTDAPALVEVWPTIKPPERPKVDDWRRPLDEVPGDDPVNMLAQRIADFVRRGIAERLAIPSRKGRPMQGRDVLVLVRRRGKLFEAIIRALKGAGGGVEVAGADRLVVADHIAALDLMALGDALLSPDDDLALAGVLKAPLFGFTDDDLMRWCPGRPGRLWDALAIAAPQEGPLADALARLERWRGEARRLRPFDFYARVLGRDGGRRAMLARLGPEAADVLDEFMALARTYESGEAATLAGFLAFLRRGGAETKRDMETGRDEVRVMTVHGAKGLEAPVVVLADTVDVPRPRTSEGFLTLPSGLPVLAPRKAEDPEVLATARTEAAARESEEYRRLLYVALTRAEDALVICGAETRAAAKDKPHARPEGCWYDLVLGALQDEAHAVQVPYAPEEVLRWRRPESLPPSGEAPTTSVSVPLPAPVVLGLAGEALEGEASAPLRPSRVLARSVVAASTAAEGLDPMVRGDLIHRLLAGLAGIAPAEREAAGLRMLGHAAANLPAQVHRELLSEAVGILERDELAEVFGPASRAEVPVAGRWTTPQGRVIAVTGRIDRLAVTERRVLIADFKTDQRPPSTGQAPPERHVSQLALYAAVLERTFPGRPVEAVLAYTRGPVIVSLDAGRLRRALEALHP
ncbi:double-strand break repair helicase AddA [Aquabacter sediminis]|uniref:double-strand break repair helicase AddA n=1 Tax=Aquabacter sediminis TaxID=3029197 RepID=UPI00237E395B|nr:double-strand break repair helicase AddA [Aquabacter sp. P-9]MDE1570117.1 double-strand break repair helicase AddA [Aquabacter sp. P-9]